jgi:hypothetical protein
MKMTEASRLRITMVAALLAWAPQVASAQSGVVFGTVYDSIANEPLPDAAVFLWETSYSAETDSQGRFRIEDVPAGDYSILFFHTQLGERGISAGPQAISVRAGVDRQVDLGTPSLATLVRTECLMEERSEGAGAVTGKVVDSESTMALGGARVMLSWQEEGVPVPKWVEVATDQEGWYRSCDVPVGLPLLLSVDFYGRQGRRREVTIGEDGFLEAGAQLFETRPMQVSGRLLDRDSGASVEGAETWLRGTGFRTLTRSNGEFSFDEVPAGTYMLMTDHLAYGTKMDTLFVPDGTDLRVEMLLDNRPIEIAPLTVVTAAPPVEMARRRGGIVITRDEIDEVRQRSRDASDIIRSLNVPGVLVRHNSNGTICVGYSTGQVKMNQDGCVGMLIFINDVRATDATMALQMPTDAIERMVLYKPVDAGNLFGLGAGDGVWMIYTRGN